MLDKILAFISISLFIAFMMVVTIYVNEPALWIIVVIGLVMGAFDFVREIRTDGSVPGGEPKA
ncbi:MAG TPA: hypothetical protein VIT83_02415 [Gammaproteobacteria bacterium]